MSSCPPMSPLWDRGQSPGEKCQRKKTNTRPFISLKALVYGLADGVLHEVNISDDLRGKRVSDMLMELSILEIICNKMYIFQFAAQYRNFKLFAQVGLKHKYTPFSLETLIL